PVSRLLMTYDVIIIGAGPAGSTVSALLARAGLRALLLEKSRFPREKVCGEFITPDCLNVFDRLGVREQVSDAGAKIVNQWTLFAPDGRGVDVPMEWIAGGQGHAIGISRARMDLILLECARQAGVDAREGFHVSPRLFRENGHENERIFIEGKADGETVERFSAPVVIDASGRNGVFSNQIARRTSLLSGSRLFGCKVHLRAVEGMRDIGELFFYRDGYGGMCDVENGRTNLCFITTEATLREARGDREKLLDLTLRSNPAARRRLRNAVIDGDWVGTGPITYGRSLPIPGVISIGDAGAFIDPFTGSGILLALRSAEIAAEVIRQAFHEGVSDVDAIVKRYDRLHRARFTWRFRACALLRAVAFNSTARNAMVSMLSRNRSLVKLMALGASQS
ncbi:MAG: NAD(P)/FAD-dependent oxidoreductase, partial [Blastocatellia bacterium]|nr:NAD(P)/FAD-dependent oxidoreductase [Blastocatellia bacterium]